jgi:hypothetical protein
MGTFIFPIFAFGCVITGVVILGVLQARDYAKVVKDLAAGNAELPADSTKLVASYVGDSKVTDAQNVSKNKFPK